MKIKAFAVMLLLASPALLFAADEAVAKREVVRVRVDEHALVLAQGWAEAFGARHPTQWADITIGNGSPISGLIRGTASLALMSRPLSPAELDEATKVFGAVPRSATVAFLADALYLQLNNPVRELTMAQLQEIYAGRITNWRAVGGRNVPIHFYAHAAQPGYDDFFLRIVMQTNLPPAGAIIFTNATEMLGMLAKDPGGIGYAPRQPALSVKYVNLKDGENSVSTIPSGKTVGSGRYPIVQPIKAYIAPNCDQAVALSLFSWLSSEEAQRYAEAKGFFRAPAAKAAETTEQK